MTLGQLEDPEYSMLEAHKPHYQLTQNVGDIPAGSIGLLMDEREIPNYDTREVDKLLLLRFSGRTGVVGVTEAQAVHVK